MIMDLASEDPVVWCWASTVGSEGNTDVRWGMWHVHEQDGDSFHHVTASKRLINIHDDIDNLSVD